MDFSEEDLRRMREMDIMELRSEQLTEIREIAVDLSQSPEERRKSYLAQTKNPYAWKSGEYILQISFQEGAEDTLGERLLLLAERLAQVCV